MPYPFFGCLSLVSLQSFAGWFLWQVIQISLYFTSTDVILFVIRTDNLIKVAYQSIIFLQVKFIPYVAVPMFEFTVGFWHEPFLIYQKIECLPKSTCHPPSSKVQLHFKL